MKPMKGEMEMDELKLKLSTKFMKGIISALISKAIFKKVGYKIDIQLNEIEIRNEDGHIHIHADVDGEVNNDEFKKIIKSIGID